MGHLISGEGIEPVPGKLDSIKNMPAPRTPKEVQQVLGPIGYYQKGFEFGYYAFEELYPIQTEKEMNDICDIQQPDGQPIPKDTKVDWGISSKDIRKAQSVDKFCNDMLNNLIQGKPIIDQPYHIEDGILRK